MKQEVYDRFKNYKENHCWQYEIRQQNLSNDLKEANLTKRNINLYTLMILNFLMWTKKIKRSVMR